MHNRGLYPILGLLALAAIAFGAWYLVTRQAPTTRVTLRFQALVGSEDLQLREGRYANPGGEGEFTVRDFQFFVSNVRLVAEDAEFAEPESYHLARFDGDDGTYRIELDSVPRAAFTQLRLGIGVDSVANGSIMSIGDLDPNGRMAWSWDVGYKFVLFEGGLQLADARIPLVYHVGFDENYTEVTIPLDAESFEGEDVTVAVCADVLRLFTGAQSVDMSELSDVKFDRDDARVLANNYAGMVSACP